MKNHTTLGILCLLLVAMPSFIGASELPGDRNVPLNIVYPPKAHVENGGPIYDITKPPFNAKGDGKTDDTRAFVAMMNAVRDGLEARRQNKASGGPAWFYVPNGTYLVSDSIVPDENVRDGFCGLRLIGQDRRKTIIRLKDQSPGFEAGARKPLLTWSKDWEHHQCGIAWGNELRNITLDTGKGNPGAVGVLFMGANACSMDNLTILSGDGQGYAGLWFPTWAVQGYFNDITIQGFDYGIEMLNPAEVNPAVEWVTLKGQRKAGIHIAQSAPSLRKVLSENTVPALRIDGSAAHVVLLDSVLSRGAANMPAIVVENPSAQVFVRDVVTSGYGAAVIAADSLIGRGQRLAFPASTVAKASFATNGDGGPEMLIDDNANTSLAGAPNSCSAPREPVWVDLVFPTPIVNLAGIELGGAEKFNNYYAKEIEVWVDSDGNRTFDTPVARIEGLGGSGKQACLLDFGGKLPSVKAIRLLVVEQNRTGSNRAFFMNGVGLLTDAKGTTLKPTPSDNVEKRIDILRTGKPPVLATVGNPNSARRTVPGGTVSEWMSGTPVRLSGTAQRSMHLPIDEVPPATWESAPTQWATPEDFTGDDQTRVQAAFDAGKPNVMLTGASYAYKNAVRIPAGVRHVELMNATPRGPALVVAEASDQPLWIHHPGNRLVIEVRAPRPLFVRYGDAAPDFITDQPMTAHLMALANTGPRAHFCPANVSLFARSINNENKGEPQFPVDGGKLWVLGFKTEGPCEAFAVRNGGILEVLGGYRNNSMSDTGKPMILNNESQVSFVGFCSMANIFREAIWETRDGQTKKLTKDDLPARSAYIGNYFVPLYLGFDPAGVAARIQPTKH